MDGERWLVVGLGNPEPEYAGTRHNLGADTVKVLAQRLETRFKAHRSGVRVADTVEHTSGTALSLALPVGYMNDTGGPVQRVTAFYKVPLERLVVVHDDLDLAFATVRLKRGGGTGGHNGLRDVQRRLGSPDFLRVRIGVGRPPGRMDPADYVLKRFGGRERPDVDVAVERAADAVLDLVTLGLEAAQNRHHGA